PCLLRLPAAPVHGPHVRAVLLDQRGVEADAPLIVLAPPGPVHGRPTSSRAPGRGRDRAKWASGQQSGGASSTNPALRKAERALGLSRRTQATTASISQSLKISAHPRRMASTPRPRPVNGSSR